jgi:class 3 adenylate cyclase
MAEPQRHRTILFADVSGSTRLYATLGDTPAHRIVNGLLRQLGDAVRDQGGRVVKTLGDEVMACFDDAPAAVAAARGMQRHFAHSVRSPDAPAGIRIGLHHGPVLEEGGDVFGDTVNMAARMVELAKAGQILTTAGTVQRLDEAARDDTRHVDRAPVRGKGELDVFEVLWGRDSVTHFVEVPLADVATPGVRVRVVLGERELLVSRERPALSLGRDESNDLVLPYGVVSRRHARLEWRRGRVLLVDESTNGTLVVPTGAAPIFVRREELALEGGGVIAPGFEPDVHPERAIHYAVDVEDAADD